MKTPRRQPWRVINPKSQIIREITMEFNRIEAQRRGQCMELRQLVLACLDNMPTTRQDRERLYDMLERIDRLLEPPKGQR
jgi:hypothetical protein